MLGTYGRGRGREAVMDVMDGVTPQWVKEFTGVDFLWIDFFPFILPSGLQFKGERRAWNARRRAPRVGSRRDGDGYLVLADDGFAQRDLQERVWSKSRI